VQLGGGGSKGGKEVKEVILYERSGLFPPPPICSSSTYLSLLHLLIPPAPYRAQRHTLFMGTAVCMRAQGGC
jgi:hypothetical protein